MLGYTTLWFVINYNTYLRLLPFFDIHISQGSVATRLRRGGVSRKFTIESVSEKKFVNRLIFGDGIGKSLVSCFFWLTVYNPENEL